MKDENRKGPIFMEFLDIYGKSFNIHVAGKEKYKSLPGSLLGAISVVVILVICIHFIIHFIKRKNMSVIHNEDTLSNPEINISNVPFIMKLNKMSWEPIHPEGIYNIEVKIVRYKPQGYSNIFNVESQSYHLEKCDITVNHGAEPPPLARQFLLKNEGGVRLRS